jgi:flagellar motor switch/type III secretory pathway protein FliN
MSAAAAAQIASPPAEKARPVAAGVVALSTADLSTADLASNEPRWRPVLDLPCQLTVDLPLPHFKVADFLALRAGSVLGTNWRLAHDIPLRINGTLIGWAEFEGAGSRLAVRVTELA